MNHDAIFNDEPEMNEEIENEKIDKIIHEEMEIVVKVYHKDTCEQWVRFINFDDKHVVLHTDIDHTDLIVNIEELKLALKKMIAK